MNTSILLATDTLEKYGDIVGCLRKNGFQNIIVATRGDEVLRHLNGRAPDFAILDVNLPVLDGFQLCKIMRSDAFKQCNNIPVVLLSGTYGTSMASQLAESVGVYSILNAPFAMEDLLLLIYNKLHPEMVAADKTKPIDKKNISDICEDAFKKYHMNFMDKHLDEVELKLYSIIEGIVDGVILLDTNGKITLVNRTGKEMFRYLDIHRNEDGSLLSLHHVGIKEIYNEIFIKKQRYVSFEIHSKEDNEKYFNVTASPLRGVAGEGTGVVIVLRDITRGHQLQYQVIKSERLYAVSNLVAGAAHELNNPLAGIQLCTDLVLNEPSISEKAKKYLNRIQKEAEQIQSVIKSLLTLTGNYTLSKEQIDINKIIEEIIGQKANQFTYANISVVKLLDEKLPVVLVDKHQMRRAFLDIVENACASMGEVKNEKCLTIQTEGHKDMVKITISDTGPGIPKEYLTKIFEPFFTAKNIKKTKGTGLGLSIAHSIVHQHNGWVYAESELGIGTKFVIELPVT